MIAITIDSEQWNLAELRGRKDKEKDNISYSKEGNKRLLEIFKKYNINATFFISGFFAEKQKKQVLDIAKNHEIACHGYNHFYRNNENLNLDEDVIKSKRILEKITKKQIRGFRAPQMQFSNELIKSLEKEGFKYDSSIHSAWLPGFYNNRKVSLKPFKIGKVTEIPASASYKLRLPFCWMFMRNLPLAYSTRIVKNLLKKGIIPVIYVHSWEFFEVKSKILPFYITRNTGEKFCKKFEKFLDVFKDEKFVTMKELI